MDRERVLSQFEEMELTESDKLEVIPETSPLLGGSRFHPLSTAKGEEDIRKISKSPPRNFEYDIKETEYEKKKKRETALRGVFNRAAARTGMTKEQFV